jgi:formylglycine-generating enzyme required for sulfatase activity
MKMLKRWNKMMAVIFIGLITGLTISAAGTGRANKNFKECNICPEMVVIPPGTFIMGSTETERYREHDEGQHRVTIDYSFAVSKAPIIWDQWEACARDAMCDGQSVETALRKEKQGKAETGEYIDYGRGNRPVVGISWWDAQVFVGWLNKKTGKDHYRLLTEAEYEYAARAGTSTAYWWGEEPSHEYANYGRDADQELGGAAEGRDIWVDETSPVCSFPVNGFGLCDMAGNVYQWVEDCYEADGTKLPADGSAVKSGNCNVRGFRGNSFMSDTKSLRSANRAFVYSPDARGRSFLGIRVARNLD